MSHPLLKLLLSVVLIQTLTSEATSEPTNQFFKDAVTHWQGHFNGKTASYSAIVSETIIPNKSGLPAGSMVTTSYVRDDVDDYGMRPVLFAFNGGPGSSSSMLHMSCLGPKKIVSTPHGRDLTDNPNSPLDVADLVFIDPVGTGFSKPISEVDGKQFWSVTGDADSCASFIRIWLKTHHRETAPILLCGESYGTSRAAQIVATATDLNVVGVIFISLVTDSPGPDLPFVATFPTCAAIAAFHGKTQTKGRSTQEIFQEAESFARTKYLPALTQGSALSREERLRVAKEMSARIGLPTNFILSKDLRLSNMDFMTNLLKDKGVRIGQLDGRVTGDLKTYATRQPPYNDPSMFGTKPGRTSGDILKEYLTKDLGYSTDLDYRVLNLDINRKWAFDSDQAMAAPATLVANAMKKRPKMNLLWTGGYFDLTTPLSAGRFAINHADLPKKRLVVASFPTGHSVYEGDENLARFTATARAFILNAAK
jgi:carboxypeptidase C (cathepsin A)